MIAIEFPVVHLPQFYARAPFVMGNGYRVPGWVVCDHRRGDAGEPIHDGTMDAETARVIAQGLNDGTITPEEVAAEAA